MPRGCSSVATCVPSTARVSSVPSLLPCQHGTGWVQQGSQVCTAFPGLGSVLINSKDLCRGLQDQGRDPELKLNWALVLS